MVGGGCLTAVTQATSARGRGQVPCQGMTEQLDRQHHDSHDAVIAEALAVIDQALAQVLSRELVSSNEVADVLLDVRSALTTPTPEPEQV
jgi:hypothetical protein